MKPLAVAVLLAVLPGLAAAEDATKPAPATGELSGTARIVTEAVASHAPRPQDVIVYLEGIPDAPADAQLHGPFEMTQLGKDFNPSVLLVPKGATVAFPNQDPFFHNVFSVTPGATFDLGQHKPGEKPTVSFERAGIVSVYCNIHPQMVGYVVVFGNRYFTHVGADGTFTLHGVPAGTWKLTAWFPFGQPVSREVTVAPHAKASVDLVLRERADVTRHARKDGSGYTDYARGGK